MPYVNVPNDLSKIKTKLAFNLTKRQLVCFGIAAAVGIPSYLLARSAIGNTGAMFLMMAVALPAFLLAMYEKDGLPFEKVVRNILRARFLRPGVRPYETAMRWTKGKYQFFVCTHIDKGHIHNHIYYNSTAQDCSRKFHNFIGSSFAVRRLSDRVCIEHELSVIQNPKQHSKGRFLHYGQWIGEKPPSAQQRVRLGIVAALEQKPTDFPAFLRLMEESGFQVKHGRGGAISFLAPGQDKYTRLRASTLGPGFDPDDIRAAIAGERPIPELPQDSPAPARRVNLIIDIQERMAQGKGPAYERWAKVYNIKQMAAALLYLREHDLMDYAALASSTEAAVDRAHKLAGELRDTEAALAKTSELMGAVVQYAKTRPVFDGYKAARYSRKYLAQHEAELADYRAAKATMNDLLGGAKLPKMDTLKKERRELSEKRKALYSEYRKAQAEMRQAVAVKANIDHLLGHTDGRENKAQER